MSKCKLCETTGAIGELCERCMIARIAELEAALNAQTIEYESRGQIFYAGLGAPSSIRLVYDLLGKEKPADLPAIKNKRIDELEAKMDRLSSRGIEDMQDDLRQRMQRSARCLNLLRSCLNASGNVTPVMLYTALTCTM